MDVYGHLVGLWVCSNYSKIQITKWLIIKLIIESEMVIKLIKIGMWK